MKLTLPIRQFRSLYTLLQALDGRAVGVGEQVILRPYKFKNSDDTRRSIRKNLRLLRNLEDGVQEDFKTMRHDITATEENPAGKNELDLENAKQLAEFTTRTKAYLDLEEEIDGFVAIDRTLLQCGENDIPNTTIEQLEALLLPDSAEPPVTTKRDLLSRLKPKALATPKE